MEQKKKKRNGVLVGSYVPQTMKLALRRIANKKKLNLSEYLKEIFQAAIEKEKRND